MAVDIVTFGCRLNAYESEVMRARAAEARLDDAVIINSCAVTGRGGAPGTPGDPEGAAGQS
jgi:threonylcarbamoyladenosine tRNA methylthiotransferase MtaB